MTFVVESRPSRRRADIPRLPSLTDSDGTASSSSKSSPPASVDHHPKSHAHRPLPAHPNEDTFRPEDVKFPSLSHSRPHSVVLDDSNNPRVRVNSLSLSFASSEYRRSRTFSKPLFHVPRSTLIGTITDHPRILSAVIREFSSADFQALICVNRQMRSLFQDPKFRDAILAQYLPGFTHALRFKDESAFVDNIRITATDFELLLASQTIPLHRYPMHALTVLSSFIPTPEMDVATERLALLTQAHSRFVLYLQSLVHSSSVPPSLDEQEARWRPSESGLRELRFPAPLSYFNGMTQADASQSVASVATDVPTAGRTAKHRKHASMSTVPDRSNSSPSRSPQIRHPDRRSSPPSHTTKQTRKSSRFSIFGLGGSSSPRSPLPPIQDQPRSLREFSTWRRTVMPVKFGSKSSSYDDLDERMGGLTPPSRRPFVSSAIHSSNSSLDEAATYFPRPTLDRELDSTGTSFFGFSPSAPAFSSPHDLAAATSRSRAPIIRAFIPCSELSQVVIDACEAYLRRSGIWPHLHGGDIICNLGFVPPNDDSPSGSQAPHTRPPPAPASQAFHDIPDRDKRTWLIFDGLRLRTIVPPDPPPLRNALSLPSPFYYSHLLPPYANPRYVLTLPPYADHLQLTLVDLWTHLPSPGAVGGYVRVKKHMWLGKLHAEPFPGMGAAWQGEWILEGEGTKEGRQSLLDALSGDALGTRLWEIVRQKSGGGRLWLKLLTTAPP